jgi:outer membrane protein OmpA-like peptidoglycan-associated protein
MVDVKIENKNRSNNNIHIDSKLSISNPIYLKSIYYNANESFLNDASKMYLDSLASIIVNSPNEMLKFFSYADSTGNENYNKFLSFEPAKKVADH